MKRALRIGMIVIIVLAIVAMPAIAMKTTVLHKISGSGTFIESKSDLYQLHVHGLVNVDYAFTAQQDSTGRISGHTTICIHYQGTDTWTFKGDVSQVRVYSGNSSGVIQGTITTSSMPSYVGYYYVLWAEDGQPDKAVISLFPSEQAYNDWASSGVVPPIRQPLVTGDIKIT